MDLFINKWNQRAGKGSRKGITKVRGLVPGDRELCREEPSPRGRQGWSQGTVCLTWSLSEQECTASFQVVSGVGRRAGSAGLGMRRLFPVVSLPLRERKPEWPRVRTSMPGLWVLVPALLLPF